VNRRELFPANYFAMKLYNIRDISFLYEYSSKGKPRHRCENNIKMVLEEM
jgi:hypothetical protein